MKYGENMLYINCTQSPTWLFSSSKRELFPSLLCDEHWPEETESSHQDCAMLRVLPLEEQEADEICDGISVPEENRINMENFKSSFKKIFLKE